MINQQKFVELANLAPSVHNTQPLLWSFQDNKITLILDHARLLRTGDPTGHDALLGAGCSLFAASIALENQGYSIKTIETNDRVNKEQNTEIAHITIHTCEPDKGYNSRLKALQSRQVERRGFLPVPLDIMKKLDSQIANNDDFTLLTDRVEIEQLSEWNDFASVEIMRARAFRLELLEWMRLKPDADNYWHDGLNQEALGFASMEARATPLVLKTLYPLIDKIKLSHKLLSEKTTTLTSAGVLLFHPQIETNPIAQGQSLMKAWLVLSSLGISAWPMASVGDHSETRKEIERRYEVDPSRFLRLALRIGAPQKESYRRARRPVQHMIVR